MRSFLRDHHNLTARQTEAEPAKKFAQHPFDAIAGYRIANPARNGYAQALRLTTLPDCDKSVMAAV